MRLPLRVSVLAVVALVHACVSDSPPTRPISTPPPAELSPTDAALAAIENRIATGDVAGARSALLAMPKELDFIQRTRKQICNAELLLLDGKPVQALQALPRTWQITDPVLSVRIERVRARAYFDSGDGVGAVRTLTTLESQLTAADDIAANRRLIWEGLKTTRLESINTRLLQADTATQGWIELARLDRQAWSSALEREQALSHWEKRYVGHPGIEYVSARDASPPADGTSPSSPAEDKPWFSLPLFSDGAAAEPVFALLLPNTGPFAASAEAIRDGFIAASLTRRTPAVVRIYDSGNTAESLRSAYEQALNEGARLIVGPLSKEDVAAIAELGEPPVPVLALNHLDASKTAPGNFYQWGLTPEDEARQAALHALSQGKTRALVFVPEGDWGQRVANAFEQQLLVGGGLNVSIERYASQQQDYGESLRKLMGLDASQERQRALSATLGLRLQFEPRRRDDADFIFFAARTDQSRQVASQLRFNRATGLPLYSLSQVYDGRNTTDLNGVRFCDMPWSLHSDGPWARLRQDFATAFPKRNRDSARLQAMGYDAHTLADLLLTDRLRTGSVLDAASGALQLRSGGAITRGLVCAEIAGGSVKLLDAPRF